MSEPETAAMLAALEGAWTAYYEHVVAEVPSIGEQRKESVRRIELEHV